MKQLKLYIFLLFAVFLQVRVHAQTYLPLIEQGKEWYTVHIFEGINATRLYVSENYSAAHDTLYYHIEQFPQAVWLMVREDVNAKKVYTRNFLDGNPTGPEKILYDFSLEEGEVISLQRKCLTSAWHEYYVDSIRIREYSGIGRRTFYLNIHLPNTPSIIWIEGIGSIAGIPFSADEGSIWSCDELMCCYFNSELLYQSQNGALYGCSFEYVDINDIKQENQVKLHPNPVIDISKIEFDNPKNEPVLLKIYNMLGICIFETQTSGREVSISKSDFAKGMYLFYLQKNNQIFYTNKFIIQ